MVELVLTRNSKLVTRNSPLATQNIKVEIECGRLVVSTAFFPTYIR